MLYYVFLMNWIALWFSFSCNFNARPHKLQSFNLLSCLSKECLSVCPPGIWVTVKMTDVLHELPWKRRDFKDPKFSFNYPYLLQLLQTNQSSVNNRMAEVSAVHRKKQRNRSHWIDQK